MGTLHKQLALFVLASLYLAAPRAFGGESAALLAQTGGEVIDAAPTQVIGGSQPVNAQLCTNCFQQLQKDNRDCESLEGQDWQICREAASTAYQRCSRGC